VASMAWPGSLAWSMAKSSGGIVGSAWVFGGVCVSRAKILSFASSLTRM
jgi:hypothetical protein